MTAVLVGGVAAVVVIRLALRRAPLITMLGVVVFGPALHAGVLRLPAVVAAPIARAHLALQDWQRRQSGDLACQVAAGNTLLGVGGLATVRVARGCGLDVSGTPATAAVAATR
jgi:hypothetical protein